MTKSRPAIPSDQAAKILRDSLAYMVNDEGEEDEDCITAACAMQTILDEREVLLALNPSSGVSIKEQNARVNQDRKELLAFIHRHTADNKVRRDLTLALDELTQLATRS